jgi:RNA polymerase sigma-70 factor (ECF subfamily)
VPTELQIVSDEMLAREAQGGSLPAFEELVHRYEARIFRFVANNSRCESDARDVTQDTFVSAYRNLLQFDPRRSFVTWLFTIARRKCIDRHRSMRNHEGQPLPEPADENTPAELLARREAGEDLWHRARTILSSAHFHALWLKYADDLSVTDIARVIGKSQTHVKVILFRARLALARELEKGHTATSAKTPFQKPQGLGGNLAGITATKLVRS